MSKKATTKKDDVHQYPVGQAVLGKMRGYPPWPGMVVDPDTVPSNVLKERPTGKKSAFNCIIFFPVGEYAWLSSKDISLLKPHEINSFLTTNPLADTKKGSKNDLREGYRIALDPQSWLQDLRKRQAEAKEKEDAAEVDQLESDDADAGGEDDDAVADVDADAEDDDAEGEPADDGVTKTKKKTSPTKKRKRDSEAADAKPKRASMGGRAKKEAGEGSKKRKSTSGADGVLSSASTKGRNGGKKSKALLESEDDADHDAVADHDDGPISTKASPPPAKKAKRDKDDDGDDGKAGDPQSSKVREWRHKLQKIFLSKATPKPDDLVPIDELFRTVEKYDGMTIDQLSFSKIGKVMRHIAALPPEKIPQESEDKYKFRTRARTLVDKWHLILNANKEGGGSGKDKAGTASPAPPAAQATINGTLSKPSDGMDLAPEPAVKEETAPDATKGDEELTRGTKNLDLNGTAPAESMKIDAPEQTVPDVPMTEA